MILSVLTLFMLRLRPVVKWTSLMIRTLFNNYELIFPSIVIFARSVDFGNLSMPM